MLTELIIPDWDAPANVRALVTTRAGGISQAPWSSLNLGDHVGDDPEAVAENRRRLAAHLPGEPVWLRQVHGTRCIDASAALADGITEADAAWSRERGVVCTVMTADCLPVLFCDESGQVVAAAHAGWRGLAAGVLEATLHTMAVPPEAVCAWIGPAIGPTAFEVGGEVREVFVEHSPVAADAFSARGNGKFLCDLPWLARQRLHHAGVRRLTSADFCTFSDRERFFSFRGDGVTGRLASCIWLE